MKGNVLFSTDLSEGNDDDGDSDPVAVADLFDAPREEYLNCAADEAAEEWDRDP